MLEWAEQLTVLLDLTLPHPALVVSALWEAQPSRACLVASRTAPDEKVAAHRFVLQVFDAVPKRTAVSALLFAYQ